VTPPKAPSSIPAHSILARSILARISPDADDLFMFRALLLGLVDAQGLAWDISTADTDALNRVAQGETVTATPDVSAISIAWYPTLAEEWQLLPHGGSVGRAYGPVVVATQPMDASELRGLRVGVPGLTTTACLVLRLFTDFEPVVVPIVPPERSFEAVEDGLVDAVLIIHEGRLTYRARGLHEVLDIGVWWHKETGLPLPLGGNAIRRSLGPDVIARASQAMRDSIAHGLAHRDDAIAWLLERGGPLATHADVDHYLSLYANADTLDYGDDGRAAIQELIKRGRAAGLLPDCPPVDFAP
jgi:1,4-dihydroxy-6-naphthoate synthase